MMAMSLLVLFLARGSSDNPDGLSFDITDYGAKPVPALSTRSIQTAVAAASAAVAKKTSSVAFVVVPKGKFLTGSFALASGVYLKLSEQAVLLGSTEQEDYPAPGWNWDPALVDTSNATNTGILGSGAIDGQQMLWVKSYDPQNNFLVPRTWEGVNGCVGECRPKLVRFVDCANVSVTGVTLRNSPDWTQLYRRVDGVLLQGLTVTGSTQWGNNDGVDFESGQSIRVLDCTFSTGDDGIVFASGNTNPNRISSPGIPLRNILVKNCSIESKSSAIKFEAIDFGGCDHGSIENVVIDGIRIRNSSRGIGFQQRNGHGNFQNITVSNIDIETLYPTGTNWWGSAEPLWISNVNSTKAEGGSGLGTIQDVWFTNITAKAENAALLSGIGRPIGPLTFRNVSLTLAVFGNATCRKGYTGSASGCTDYRPVDFTPAVALGSSAGLRIEGAGVADFYNVTVTLKTPKTGVFPSYWLSCVDHPTLSYLFDPLPQKFNISGLPIACRHTA